MNSIIASYGAEHHIPVINYGDALCGCVGSVTPGSGIGTDIFSQYGGGPFMIVPPNPKPFPYDYPLVITPAGYSLMTNLAEIAIATLDLCLEAGYLRNLQQYSILIGENGLPLPNVNSVNAPSVVQFIPMGCIATAACILFLTPIFKAKTATGLRAIPL